MTIVMTQHRRHGASDPTPRGLKPPDIVIWSSGASHLFTFNRNTGCGSTKVTRLNCKELCPGAWKYLGTIKKYLRYRESANSRLAPELQGSPSRPCSRDTVGNAPFTMVLTDTVRPVQQCYFWDGPTAGRPFVTRIEGYRTTRIAKKVSSILTKSAEMRRPLPCYRATTGNYTGT